MMGFFRLVTQMVRARAAESSACGGTLAGTGIISGAVIVGSGDGSGGVLSPGLSDVGPGTLTLQSKLLLNSDGIYQYRLNSDSGAADQVVANGVTISDGAPFSFADGGSGVLPVGSVFTVINNTAVTPIDGSFDSLPDGSTFTSGSNTFQASYEGGTGNDLTLTVQ